jgi:hypothetical protein
LRSTQSANVGWTSTLVGRNGAARPCENLRGISQRRQRDLIAWEPFMGANHKIAARQQVMGKASKHLSLQRLRKVGKRDIPTKDKIKTQGGRLRPHILVRELDPLAMLLPHAE